MYMSDQLAKGSGGCMNIRIVKTQDILLLMKLFYETVHYVNSQDYSAQQIAAWAPENPSLEKWQNSLKNTFCLIAEENAHIVGFGDMSLHNGKIERLYTHKDYQGKGVASLILQGLENRARQSGVAELMTESSITALPFFLKRGFLITKEQNKLHNGLVFRNFLMKKKL
jgi:putative acetyltransferase